MIIHRTSEETWIDQEKMERQNREDGTDLECLLAHCCWCWVWRRLC